MENEYLNQIKDILDSSLNDQEKKDKLNDYHENDIASVVKLLTKEERLKLYKLLGVEKTSEIFSYLDNVEDYVEELNYEQAADIIEQMDADDAVDVLDELKEDDAKKILNRMDNESAKDVKLIHSYEEDQIGSLMTTNYIYIPKESTITSAMKQLVSQAGDNDNISSIFVLNDDKTLYGMIELKDLICARKNSNIEDIILLNTPYVKDVAKIDEVINDVRDYDMQIIPVLDSDNKLVGVITSSDIVEAVDDQISEDYAKLAGLSKEDEIDEPLLKSLRKRLPWLIILMFLGLLVSFVTGRFEAVIATLPAIVAFQSMVLDMAGNVGTQSLAVTIRYISDDDENKKAARKIIWHEIKIGILNGLILAIISIAFITLYLGLTKSNVYSNTDFSWFECFKAGSIVGLALFIAMSVSSFTGSFLPILLTKMHIDPAVASGPFITTINDLIAIVIYYGLAWLFFLVI